MPTIQAVIDLILADMHVPTLPQTVDVVVSGDPAQDVTGIVTTFVASHEVLQRAVDAGANLVISHETAFYNHQNRTDWLTDDPVYQAKKQFADAHGLVIWRSHDYWHRRQPDGIVIGMLRALDWTAYSDPATPTLITLPPTRLGDLVAHVQAKLGSGRMLVIGDADQVCTKVALSVGFSGVERHIEALNGAADVVIAGEVHEWETAEYVRDAQYQGLNKALIVTGHAVSEEAGMAYLAEWLRERLPDLPITHLPSGDPFQH